MNKKLAIIDLGTNTFHLLIAEVEPKGSCRILSKEKVPVMIGRQGINHGTIIPEAQQRAVKTLKAFRATADREGVAEIYATATSAFRNAKNGQQLADTIRAETGIIIDIIPGDREAECIFLGVREALDLSEKDVLIMDIGGGSVEFILGNRQQMHWRQSFEIGAQRLLDLFAIQDPISEENIRQLNEYFDQQLKGLEDAIGQYRPQTLVGASGTFDTLSDIYAYQENLTLSGDETELPLPYAGFLKIHQEIIHKNREERLQIPGMIEMRVEMIVVASCLITYIVERYAIKNIRVSAYALKEGLLKEILERFSATD